MRTLTIPTRSLLLGLAAAELHAVDATDLDHHLGIDRRGPEQIHPRQWGKGHHAGTDPAVALDDRLGIAAALMFLSIVSKVRM